MFDLTLKKKKKSKTVVTEDAAPATEEGGDVPDEVAAMFDLTQKKKKKKKKTTDSDAADQGEGGVEAAASAGSSAVATEFELDPPVYTYSQLLNRVVDFVHQNNPDLVDKKRFTMKPPQLMRGRNS
jgi:hypothetical protein